MNPVLAKNFTASAAIARNRIVVLAANGTVAQAANATTPELGISQELDVAANERVDVTLLGIEQLTLGAAVNAGQLVTSDAQGRGIVAAADNNIVGMALESGTVNERIRMLIAAGKA